MISNSRRYYRTSKVPLFPNEINAASRNFWHCVLRHFWMELFAEMFVYFLYFFKLKFLSFLISVFVIKAKFFSFRTEKFPNKLFLNWGQDRTLKETHWNCFLSQWYYTMYNTGSFAHLREIKTILEDSSTKPICTVSLMAI